MLFAKLKWPCPLKDEIPGLPDGETFAEFFSSSSTIITEAAMLPRGRKASLDDVTVSDFDALSDDYFPK